jgi:pimeloyl-[acyl-carrier protein] methyl ester esterase
MIAEFAVASPRRSALHIRAEGAGPDLVLLHGWGLSGAVFADLLPRLATRWRVHCVDLPGHGGSVHVPLVAREDAARRLVDALPRDALWFGWSLGGLLALESAGLAPGIRVVTLATNPRFLAASDWSCGLEPGVLQGFADGLGADYEATLGRFLALQTRGLSGGRDVLRRLRDSLVAAPPRPEALAGGLEILRGADLRQALAPLGSRLHMWFGDRDPLVPACAAEAVARCAPEARVERVAGWGHAPFLADPDALAARLAGLSDD